MNEIQSFEKVAQKMEAMEKELSRVKAELSDLKSEALRGDDYHQIMNAMAGHVYGYHSQAQEFELDRYWAKDHDIVLAHWDLAFCGKDSVYQYYVEKNERTKSAARATIKKVYNMDIPENECAGYRVMDMLTSPYIEIAKDRKTAKGVWMMRSFGFRMDQEGHETATESLKRVAGEFVNENGRWKLWHYRDYGDLSMDVSITKPYVFDENHGPPPGPSYEQSLRMGCKTLGIEQPAREFHPWNTVKFEPALPEPYETWDDSQSYINVIMDGYTNW